ncbi:tyrosine-type recombinase/integrase [Geodermatophilus sp. SYSU D00710]
MLTVLEYAAFLTTARTLGPAQHAIALLGGMMGLRATEMATLTVESFATVRGYATLLVLGKGDKPARVPVPIRALDAVTTAIDGRDTGPLLRTRSGAGMDRRSVHRYVAATAKAAGISRPTGPHALRRTVGTVGLSQGIPLRDVQRPPFGIPARRPLWAATTSAARRWNATPLIRSPASSPAGPAEIGHKRLRMSPPAVELCRRP